MTDLHKIFEQARDAWSPVSNWSHAAPDGTDCHGDTPNCDHCDELAASVERALLYAEEAVESAEADDLIGACDMADLAVREERAWQTPHVWTPLRDAIIELCDAQRREESLRCGWCSADVYGGLDEFCSHRCAEAFYTCP